MFLMFFGSLVEDFKQFGLPNLVEKRLNIVTNWTRQVE